MRRFVRALVVTLALGGAIGLSSGTARADHTPTPFFKPPPGCTDDWNTAQSAANAHAPKVPLSPGCAKNVTRS